MMKRAKIGIGVGLGLGALALSGIVYKAVDSQRRQRAKREFDQRLETWEAEGGAPLEAPMPQAARSPSL